MKYLFSTFVSVLLLSSQTLFSQKQWSLTECIDYAHANNLQVKQAQYQASMASNDLFQSKLNLLPDLNAEAGRNYSYGYGLNPTTNDFSNTSNISDNYALNSSVSLFSGLTNYNTIKLNEYNTLSKMQEVEKEKIELTLDIASAYLQILFSRELLDVAISQRDIAKLQVERTSKLVEAGSVARGDLLEIKAQLAAEEYNVTSKQNEKEIAYLNLTQLLDLKSAEGFDVVIPATIDSNLSSPVTDVSIVYSEALLFLPHIKSAEYIVQANEKYYLVQKGRLSPSLFARGSWTTAYSNQNTDPAGIRYPYFEQLDNFSNKNLSLGIQVPIFNKWMVKNDISNARIGVMSAENTLNLTKQQLYKEIQQSYIDAVSSSDKYKSAYEAVESYREAFSYTEQKFNVGIVNSVDYNIAKNNYIKAQSELLKAKYEYVFAVKILDFYRGIAITL